MIGVLQPGGVGRERVARVAWCVPSECPAALARGAAGGSARPRITRETATRSRQGCTRAWLRSPAWVRSRLARSVGSIVKRSWPRRRANAPAPGTEEPALMHRRLSGSLARCAWFAFARGSARAVEAARLQQLERPHRHRLDGGPDESRSRTECGAGLDAVIPMQRRQRSAAPGALAAARRSSRWLWASTKIVRSRGAASRSPVSSSIFRSR